MSNDLECQFHCSVVSVKHIVTKQLRLELCGFCYKVALYLCYLYLNFDNKNKTESLRISRIIYHWSASKVKLTFRLCYIYSQSLLLDTSVTRFVGYCVYEFFLYSFYNFQCTVGVLRLYMSCDVFNQSINQKDAEEAGSI